MEKLFDVYYTNSEGKELKVRYCCIDKSQARRLFFSEIQKGEELKRIVEVIKCSELQKDRPVVFRVDPYYQGNKQVYDGTVLWVNENQRTVEVSYLEGYKDRSDAIPFEDMIAAYDENGEMMDFGGVKGKSVLLIAD